MNHNTRPHIALRVTKKHTSVRTADPTQLTEVGLAEGTRLPAIARRNADQLCVRMPATQEGAKLLVTLKWALLARGNVVA